MPEVVTFQTSPTIVRKQQADEYKECRESTPLLDHHPSRSCPPSPLPAVAAPPLKALLTSPVITAGLNRDSFTTILPVYLVLTPLSIGPRAFGIIIGNMGIFSSIFQAVCTTALVERWGAKRVYQASVCAFFPLWDLFPVVVKIATTAEIDFLYPRSLWFLACIGVVFATVMEMSFSKHSQPAMVII